MADNLIIFNEKKNALIAANHVYHPYRGYTLLEPRFRGTRIRLEVSDLPENYTTILSYSCLINVECTGNNLMLLTFSNNTVVTVHGAHLDQLFELLQDELVRSLEVFMPRWNLPPRPNSVFISAIEIHTHAEWNASQNNLKNEPEALTSTPAPQE